MGYRTFAVALLFLLSAQGPAVGEVCGGVAGTLCDDGEFCKLPQGRCCCDYQGTCTEFPPACTFEYDPVCGCDRTTYFNDCEANAVGVSLIHRGVCHESADLVQGVRFEAPGRIVWDPTPGAVAYNVYRKEMRHSPPPDAGECHLPNRVETWAPADGEPDPEMPWLFPGRRGAPER